MLTNSKQYLTNLASAGIVQYQLIANEIPVLPWYCHNMVLTVLCLSGIVIVPILAIYRKPLMLGWYSPNHKIMGCLTY
jgi:hypothetical protein